MISVKELLFTAVEKYRDFVALKDETQSVTYHELYMKAIEIAAEINCCMTGKNHPILVITTKTIESVIAFWGIVLSGNYYVAVDSKTPDTRFCELIKTVQPELILYTEKKQKDILPSEIPNFFINDCIKWEEGKNWESWKNKKRNLEQTKTICMDPLYMVFTSGSTGKPKAIIKNHQSILTFVEAFVDEFHLDEIGEREIFGNQASFDYDISAKDIYLSARIGATLCIIPQSCFLKPATLVPFMKENKITILIWSAAAIKYVKKMECFNQDVPTTIKMVFFSGESMPEQYIQYWRQHIPSAVYVNLYAPSEVTGNCLYHIVTNEKYGGYLPLDKVFQNIDVIVMGERETELKEGEKGELYIRGSFLAMGYYNDLKQTTLRFVQNPLHNNYPDIVYRTGDFFILRNQKLFFAGREDHQIKHMGHRLELEEVEEKILHATGYDSICVVYDWKKEKIILITDDNEIVYKNIVNLLKPTLPKYMIPHEIFYIKRMPINNRGKIDRKKVFSLYEEKNENTDY